MGSLRRTYDDNLYDQSIPIPLSVFGRPLLSGGFSGQGVSLLDKAPAPLRVVVDDGRDWRLESLGAIIKVGEEIGDDGQRKTEAHSDALENWNYGCWESSCLAKI